MGLEFSFDDISLEKQVSREQLEIDLYDELITITDAEPDEQVRLLAARPQVGSDGEADKPESIRITASLAKAPTTSASASPGQIVAGQNEASMTTPPTNGAKSQPLPSINPADAEARPEVPRIPPRNTVQAPEPIPTPNPAAIPAAPPSPKTREMTPPRALVQQPVPEPPRVTRPSAPVPPPKTSAPVIAEASGCKCPECGQPAGELDMICIECGSFLG